MAEYKLICCVVNIGEASKTLKIAQKYGIKNGTISIGKGTVSNKFLEFLKIDELKREIVAMIVEAELASEAMKGISKEMSFDKPYHGIAFSCNVSRFIGAKNMEEKNTEINEVKNSMYNAIYVVVERGRAEDVVDAAKKAGARGATIVNARGSSGNYDSQKLFSLEIEPEKEKVIIIVKNELKNDIVNTIREDLMIDETGNGIIFVLDIDETYGLR